MMLSWNDYSGLGPIQEEDLANLKNFTDIIKHYFDKPSYVNMQPGLLHMASVLGSQLIVINMSSLISGIWRNGSTRIIVEQHTIMLAPMQTSPTAFIIGIAVGSSENQDVELLN